MIKAVCIRCFEKDALVTMDLDGTCEFECHECGERFDVREVRRVLDEMNQGWGRLLEWVENYPTE